MAVTYMKELEKEPETYDKYFSSLTKKVNENIYSIILENIKSNQNILEIGCGPGSLSIKIAEKGAEVLAIDQNPEMIKYAKMRDKNSDLKIEFMEGSAVNLPDLSKKYDIAVSTFMLSELRIFEQQQFLRSVWKVLKPNGRLLIAAEFEPKGVSKIPFLIKRQYYHWKLKQKRTGVTHPLKWFLNYFTDIGFKEISTHNWTHNSIKLLELEKIDTSDNVSQPGYYTPKLHPFKGFKSFLRAMRCLFTGQMDHVSIEPGIYKSGNPNPESPVIVTANYEYTYYNVMNDLRGTDAWVLCVDSNGINVWCAARGGNFGNKQLIEAVETSGLREKINHNKLILPELSAGGVSVPELPKDFGFNVIYGPIWSKFLPEYLVKTPKNKPPEMRIAKFDFTKRLEAGLTHTTFILRSFVFWPSILLFLIFLVPYFFYNWNLGLNLLGSLWELIIGIGFGIAFVFPITNFTRRFIIKGLFFGILASICLGIVVFLLYGFFYSLFGIVVLTLWLTFFITMSFSGYTMETSIREISAEYGLYNKIFRYLLLVGIVLVILGVILQWLL